MLSNSFGNTETIDLKRSDVIWIQLENHFGLSSCYINTKLYAFYLFVQLDSLLVCLCVLACVRNLLEFWFLRNTNVSKSTPLTSLGIGHPILSQGCE